ncbi:MAG: hypothetical protein U5L09_11380 [Bacteroidales bacterium]|nr:hypothetical protein [Bacteroidales bacterium]
MLIDLEKPYYLHLTLWIFNYDNVEVKQDYSNYELGDYQTFIQWTDGCAGGGAYGLTTEDHEIINAYICFLPDGPTNPDNYLYNQELGSAFGATFEPDMVDAAETVFLTTGNTPTYTEHDYDGADVYLNRSLVHYRNYDFDMDDPEGWDWELHPDEVKNYYPTLQGNAPEPTHFIMGITQPNGQIKETTYEYDKVPERVKKQFPFTFPEANQDFFERRKNPKATGHIKSETSSGQRQYAAADDLKRQFMQNRAIEKARRAWKEKQASHQKQPEEKTPAPAKKTHDPVNPPHSR